MIYVFLATGFEDIEALAPVDIMRRAGLAVETVSITGELVVMSAHGVGIMADTYIEDIDFDDADIIVLPGGLPGATNLDACASLRKGIMKLYEEGKPLAAICAAPSILGHRGLLKGHKALCYAGFESQLEGAEIAYGTVCLSGNFLTSRGPGTAIDFSLKIVEILKSRDISEALASSLLYTSR